METVSNIEYVGGQLGFFFGGEEELQVYVNLSQQNKKHSLRVQVQANDFFHHFKLSKLGEVTRYNLNITAIKTLRALNEANAAATHHEQLTMSRYVGWGGCAKAFDVNDTKWSKRHHHLKGLLSASQWNTAQASTLSSFYTPDFLSAAIYKGLLLAGVNDGTFLDTSAGVGGLIRTMPETLYRKMDINLVEQDQISANILEKLYPTARIQNTGFEAANFNKPMSLVFHNPPFGQAPIFDSDNKALSGLTLHNYFLAKSVSLLAEKGWMIAIVSRAFMDAKNSKNRELVGQNASLKAAVRLPKQVFEVGAGANATVDVLVFEQGAETNTAWYNSENVQDVNGKDYLLNQYFIDHPEQIKGVMQVLSEFQGNNVHCIGDCEFEAVTTKAIAELFSDLTFNGQTTFSTIETPKPVAALMNETHGTREGSFAIGSDNAVYQLANEKWHITEFTGTSKARITALCGIRHTLMTLLDAEQEDRLESDLDTLRAELNQRYDEFVKTYGYIHDAANQRVAKLDPTNYNLLSLEISYNAGLTKAAAKKLGVNAIKPSATKAEIFNQRVLSPWVKPTSAESVEDALIASINVYGKLDINYCAELLSTTDSEFINRANGELIFWDAQEWVTKNVYLSGDVKTKLGQIPLLPYDADTKNRYESELRKVIPLDVPFENIKVNLGANWVPASVYQEFVSLLCDGRENIHTTIKMSYAASSWHVDLACLPYQLETRLGSNSAYRFSKLLPCIMNGKPTQVTFKDENGRRIVNKQATLENEINAEKIIGEWDSFLLSRLDVQEKLSAIYNEKFNRFSPLMAAGNSITLPDSNAAISLREHQLNAVYRAITEGRLLIAHEVGAGKTFTISAIVHECIRLGLKQRATVVVPNHLTSQFAAGYLQLYPQDQITVLNPDDLSPSRRNATLLRLKTGTRVVICPESSFAAIPVDEDIEQMVIESEIDKLEHALNSLTKEDGGRFTVKNIENKKAKLKARLKELANDDRKKGLTICDLGVDMLVLDEAHYIKNLSYESNRLTNVRGCGNPVGSKRSFDWYLKIQSLKRDNKNGLGVIFSTGTPISNTLLEAYTFLRYLNEEGLAEQGIESIDDFVSIYATVSSDFEVSPCGGFKSVTRLRKFNNMPQLQALWSSIADSVNERELKMFLPSVVHNGVSYSAIPPLTGGKPRQLVVDATQAQEDFSKTLIQRAKCFASSPIDNDNMLLVMSQAKKSSVDMRLLEPSIPASESGQKIKTCIAITAEKYHSTTDVKGTQIIFLDIGVPNKEGRHCVYDDIRSGLINAGVKVNEIAYAQSYKTPLQKTELYAKLNTGIIRVVIASTNTLGCGANVNKRLVAITILDAPYRPADLTQRLGRGVRQGNQLYLASPDTFTLDITYIATKNSLDCFLFQTLENKQKFISDFNSSSTIVSNESVDLSSAELTFAELKAETSGSPLVLEMVMLTKTIQRLEAQRHAFIRNQRDATLNIDSIKSNLDRNQELVAALLFDKDSGCYVAQTSESFTYINARGVSLHTFKTASIEITAMIRPLADSINNGFYRDTKVILGEFAGFNAAVTTQGRSMTLLLKGSTTYSFNLDLGKVASLGKQILMTINNFITNVDKHIEQLASNVTNNLASLEVAENAINATFDELDQLIECKQRMVELKSLISELDNEDDTTSTCDPSVLQTVIAA
jgi:N12 class adenine-specific DNA methylase/adenine-specific DNA methylase